MPVKGVLSSNKSGGSNKSKFNDLKMGETQFQWVKGDTVGKIETFSHVMDPEDESGSAFIVFRSGVGVFENDLKTHLKRIRKDSDIDHDILAEYNKREKELRKEKSKKSSGIGGGSSPDSLAMDQLSDEEKKEIQKIEEEKKRKREEEEADKEAEEKKKKKGEPKKAEAPESDPIKSLLKNQEHRVTENIDVEVKFPSEKMVEALKESFKKEDIDERVVEVALEDMDDEEFLERLKDSLKEKLFRRIGGDTKELNAKNEDDDQ